MTAEAPVTVDLAALVNSRVDVKTLSGHERGAEARAQFRLDQLDRSNGTIRVVFPRSVVTTSPSFLQGMLGGSIRALGADRFKSRYEFAASKIIQDQVDEVVKRLAARPAI